jgi:hypothetical protein
MELANRFYQVLRGVRGAEEANNTVKLPADAAVEVCIESGRELIPVAKVVEVHVDGALWVIKNAKNETLYFSAERIAGLRVNESSSKKTDSDRSAGFTRGL